MGPFAREAEEDAPPRGRDGEEEVQKNLAELLQALRGWAIVCVDESIFTYDALVRRVWAVRGSKPRILITGSHRRTCVYGAMSSNGRQLFRQHPNLKGGSFLSFLKLVRRKFRRSLLIMDEARWHRTKGAGEYLAKQKDILVLWLPKYSPELNPMEECWRQPKNELMLKLYPSFEELRRTIARYYRTKRFKLNLINYLCR